MVTGSTSGFFCHEFGHLLGLPDLYDTNEENGTDSGVGHWCLMARGGWGGQEATPSGLSAWSKSALDWAEVKDITDQHGDVHAVGGQSEQRIF